MLIILNEGVSANCDNCQTFIFHSFSFEQDEIFSALDDSP